MTKWHVKCPSPTIPGSNSVWTYRYIELFSLVLLPLRLLLLSPRHKCCSVLSYIVFHHHLSESTVLQFLLQNLLSSHHAQCWVLLIFPSSPFSMLTPSPATATVPALLLFTVTNISSSLFFLNVRLPLRFLPQLYIFRDLFRMQIYHVVGWLWTLNWILAFGQCVLAGAFASYYWAFNKPHVSIPCGIERGFG